MKRTFAALCTFMAALLGCGREVVRVDVPVDASTLAFVVALDHEGRLEVSAHEVGDPIATLPSIRDLDGEVMITLLRYGSSLLDLGLERGALALEEDPVFATALPAHASAARTLVSGGTASAWAELAGIDGALSTFRVRGAPICGAYSANVVTLTTTVGATAVARLEDGVALVASRNGDAHRVTASGAERIDLGTPIGFQPSAIYRAPDGELFISGDGPRLVRGRIGAFVEAPVPEASDLRYLAGPAEGDFELFALSKTNGLYRFDGSSWETVWSPSDPPGEDGALVYLGPGRAAGVSGSGDIVLVYDRARSSPEIVNVPFIIEKLVALASVPGVGLVGATGLRNVVRVGDPFERVVTLPVADEPIGLHTLGDGFVAISDRGGLVEYHPRIENCPGALGERLPVVGLATADLGGSYILVGHRSEALDPTQVVVYTRNLPGD
jgi:hypothetical protein